MGCNTDLEAPVISASTPGSLRRRGRTVGATPTLQWWSLRGGSASSEGSGRQEYTYDTLTGTAALARNWISAVTFLTPYIITKVGQLRLRTQEGKAYMMLKI